MSVDLHGPASEAQGGGHRANCKERYKELKEKHDRMVENVKRMQDELFALKNELRHRKATMTPALETVTTSIHGRYCPNLACGGEVYNSSCSKCQAIRCEECGMEKKEGTRSARYTQNKDAN